jgi:hypothetical protein
MIASVEVQCILCGSSALERLRSVVVADIVRWWRKEYGIDVRRYFATDAITNYRCRACTLDFFFPPSPGDDELYAQLQEFDWYYEDAKWEFDKARSLVTRPGPVLEIGCGFGPLPTA